MTIILKLQGLDGKAGTEDIRTFFEGLHIPDGGVYIVGGSLREAFIAFSSEREAQLAMRFTGKSLKGSKVTLHISSMAELEQKLKSLLKKKKPSPTHERPVKKPHSSPDAIVPPLNACPNVHNRKKPSSMQKRPVKRPQSSQIAIVPPLKACPNVHNPSTEKLQQPLNFDVANLQPLNSDSLDANTAFLLGICTVLQGLQASLHDENDDAVPKAGSTAVFDEVRKPMQSMESKPGYVRLFGLPATTTKEDICQFFKGLTVLEAIVNVELGCNHICLVKFASTQDACDALRFNKQSLGSISVEVRSATEKMWTCVLQEFETPFDVEENVRPMRDPRRRTENYTPKTTYGPQHKRYSIDRLSSTSPKKLRPDGDSRSLSPTTEYIVMVSNLPKTMTKTEIKELFGCPNIAHTNVLHLLDKDGSRTDTAFLIFDCTEDYDYAMNLTGCHVGSDTIKVSSITKDMMRNMMAQTRHWSLERHRKMDANRRPVEKRKSSPVEPPEETLSMDSDPAAKTCLFVRNLPADVREGHLKRLFCKYKVRQDDIILLSDNDGKGIGEALVQFKSQKLAAQARKLHGLDFLGTQVLLTCITVKQMEDILARHV